MELILTPEQKKSLNTHGPLKAEVLQRIYKKSVEDQRKTLNKAAKLQKKQK